MFQNNTNQRGSATATLATLVLVAFTFPAWAAHKANHNPGGNSPVGTTLSTLGCTGAGEIAKYNATTGAWECAADAGIVVQAEIRAVTVDNDSNQIVILGQGFTQPLQVTLGDAGNLGDISANCLLDALPTMITCDFSSAGLPPAGDYLLTVNGALGYGLTIGAMGPAGPPGDAADAVAAVCVALEQPAGCNLRVVLGLSPSSPPVLCNDDKVMCPGGTLVHRDPTNNCHFCPCSTPGEVTVPCGTFTSTPIAQ